MQWVWIEGETIIAMEDLAILCRIIEDEELQAKGGEQNMRTIRIQ